MKRHPRKPTPATSITTRQLIGLLLVIAVGAVIAGVVAGNRAFCAAAAIVFLGACDPVITHLGRELGARGDVKRPRRRGWGKKS